MPAPRKKPPSRAPPAKNPKPLQPHGRPPRVAPALPKNWPSTLPHFTRPQLSPHLPASTVAALRIRPSAAPTPPSALIRILPITARAHPAYGQHGLFAAQRIPRDTWVLDYLGYYHGSGDTDPASDYDIWLDRGLDVAIDAARGGNEGRFINDYRGTGGRRNVEFRVYTREDGEVRMGVWTTEEVARGVECCVSYGKGFWEGRKEEGGE